MERTWDNSHTLTPFPNICLEAPLHMLTGQIAPVMTTESQYTFKLCRQAVKMASKKRKVPYGNIATFFAATTTKWSATVSDIATEAIDHDRRPDSHDTENEPPAKRPKTEKDASKEGNK